MSRVRAAPCADLGRRRLPADPRPSDLRHRPSRASPLGRGGGGGEDGAM